MNIDPFQTPERRALRALVRDFTEREIVPHIDEWERTGELPRELHKKASAAGVLGVGFPESVGGQGGDSIDATIVTEELIQAGGSSGVCAGLLTHGIALPHIARAVDPQQIARFGPADVERRGDRRARCHRAGWRFRCRSRAHPGGARW